jgi:hypothetical protein
VLGGRFEGVETLLGHSERGRFVKAPDFRCKNNVKIIIIIKIMLKENNLRFPNV